MVVVMRRRLLLVGVRHGRLHVTELLLLLLRGLRGGCRRDIVLLLGRRLRLLLEVVVLVRAEAAWVLGHQPESGHGERVREERRTRTSRRGEQGWQSR